MTTKEKQEESRILDTIGYWADGLLTEGECDWHMITTQEQREELRARERSRTEESDRRNGGKA